MMVNNLPKIGAPATRALENVGVKQLKDALRSNKLSFSK
jgi:hypothetical protein